MERKQKKIKILFTIPNFDTAGSGKALLNIANHLDDKYFEPHIACFHQRGEFFKNVQESGFSVHIFKFTASMEYRIKGLFHCYKISRKFKKINPHLIHSFHYSPDYSEVISARMANIPWIFTKKNMNWGGKSKNGWRMRSYLSSHIIMLNTTMKKRYYPTLSKTTVIPRGVCLKEFSTNNSKILSCEDFGIPKNSKIVMLVANLVPVKGVEYLIEAFSNISDREKSIYLLIVGDNNNDYGRELKKNVNKKNKADKIFFLGKRDDISNLLQLAYIFILPTIDKGRSEGFGVVTLEAMASGVPVLASDVPGSSDILNDIHDQLFPPEDISILINKLNWMLNLNDKKRTNLINKQLKIIRKNFTIEKETEQHSLIYKKLCNLKYE